MGVTLALLAAATLAALAWLRWVPLRLTAEGVVSTERPNRGQLDLQLWPLACTWRHTSELSELRVVVAGVRLWRGAPSGVAGRRRKARQKKKRRPDDRTRIPTASAIAEIASFARAQLHQVDVALLEGELRFGFDDPYTTGLGLAALHVALGTCGPAARGQLQLVPLWFGTTQLDAAGAVRLRVFAGRMLLAGAALGVRLARLRQRNRRRARPRAGPAPSAAA